MNNHKVIILLSLLLLGILQSCGGSGGGGSVAGIDGTGRPINARLGVTAVGTISSTSNFVVNGVEYDTSAAQVIIDNAPASVSALSLGQVVMVTGTLDESGNTGVATQIDYNTSLLGTVDSIDADQQSLIILGQVVRVGPNSFDGSDRLVEFADIQLGDSLRVSGFALANDELASTYIERNVVIVPKQGPVAQPLTFQEVNGVITNVTANTFQINDLTIDYSDIATPLDVSDGIAVEVLGVFNPISGQFIAQSVRVLAASLVTPEESVQLQGFITQFRSVEDFEVNGVRVLANNTLYQNGVPTDLAINSQIEVEGVVTEDGVLLADNIIFLVASLTSHTSLGERQLDSTEVEFTWHDVDADAYRLSIFSGGRQFYTEDFDAQTTSTLVTGLPENSALLQVYMHTQRDGTWLRSQGISLVSPDILTNAELVSHGNGEELTSDVETFTWTDVSADEYRVSIRNNEGVVLHNRDYPSDVTSVVIDDLPIDGKDLTFILATRHGVGWNERSFSLKSFSSN